MTRKPRDEPDWTDDKKSEATSDVEDAEYYGFKTSEITKLRNDLDLFLWTFHNGAFSNYEFLHDYINKSALRLAKELAKIADVSSKIDGGEIALICESLNSGITRLRDLSDRLPRRPHSIEKIGVSLIISYWVHGERRPSYRGPRKIVLSFDSEGKPIHFSAQFIVRMLQRSKGELKGVSVSTIKRAKLDLGSKIPRPEDIHPFKGDFKLYAI